MYMSNLGNVEKCTKYNRMEMPNPSTKCYKVYRNLVALFTKCYGIQKQKQHYVMNYITN